MSETTIEQVEFEWQAFPAREQPSRALVGGVLVLGLAWGAALLGQSLFWGVAAVLFLVAVLSRFFMPSRFVITSEGILAIYPLSRRFLRWCDVRRFASDEHGGFMSTRARASALDPLQGMHLLFGRVRDEAIRTIRQHLAAQSASAGVVQNDMSDDGVSEEASQ